METKKKFRFNDYKFGELYPKFGIIATHFMTFNDNSIQNYNPECGLTQEEYLKEIKTYLLSTVYDGIRYFFDCPEKLQAFCEMVEK